MPERKYRRRIVLASLIVVALIITIAALRYLYPSEKAIDSVRILPGQTYLAWNGKSAPSGYVFHEIIFSLYINDTLVYGSGMLETSWTCPEYVYGQEGNSTYRVGYALVWTDGNLTVAIP